tara:strand:- start:369 stop:488 length:120 start_codon:yes stop_codon:yes gene_type:complete
MSELIIGIVVVVLLYLLGHKLLPEEYHHATWGNLPKEEE